MYIFSTFIRFLGGRGRCRSEARGIESQWFGKSSLLHKSWASQLPYTKFCPLTHFHRAMVKIDNHTHCFQKIILGQGNIYC